ncbi:MAG: prolipoprotein diacylglyceryl transferase [Clostridiales bacterium]|nr:prolipoprotein diacylglyceryl transferase [Clostridiales bacterium]
MNHISFPNIGIDRLPINRVAFSLFGRDIYWYGIIITFAICIAFLIVLRHAKQEYIKKDDIYDLAIWVILFGMIGARLYYVLTSLDQYDNLLDTFKIWEGGLAFYGCIIGGALACVVVAKFKKISFAILFDMLSPAVLIGQAIGRWGNFFNAEAFGSAETLDLFGKTFDVSGVVHAPWIMQIGNQLVQPTFLYECIWDLIGFVLLSILYKKKKYNGQICLWYLAWYGFGRMFIEGLRTDSLYIGSIRISQLVGLLCVVFGIALHFVFLSMAKKRTLAIPFTKREPVTNTEEADLSTSNEQEKQLDDSMQDETQLSDIKETNEPEQTEQEDVTHGENH